MSRDDDEEGVFSRWSRRKRAAATPQPDAPPPDPRVEETTPAPEDALPEDELLKKLGLPDPDTLQPGDDFRAFMAKQVPQHLRQRALRRLWSSNPVLANVDGLVDYGDDFTDAAMVPEVLQTAYRVGKGFLRDAEEPAEADTETAEIQDESSAAGGPETEPDAADIAEAGGPETPEPDRVADGGPAEQEPEPPRPRRMTFRTG